MSFRMSVRSGRQTTACCEGCTQTGDPAVRRATGGMRSATALADTFGTEAFVAAAVATPVPPEFVADIAETPSQGFPAVSIDLPPGTRVFCASCVIFRP